MLFHDSCQLYISIGYSESISVHLYVAPSSPRDTAGYAPKSLPLFVNTTASLTYYIDEIIKTCTSIHTRNESTPMRNQ